MTLKMGFKIQMTLFRSQKLLFDHVTLYYDYYITMWINPRCHLKSVTAVSLKALEVRIYLTYGVMIVKKKNKNCTTSIFLNHLLQIHKFPCCFKIDKI